MPKHMSKRQLKHHYSHSKPLIWIGKRGVSQSMLAEIDRQLEQSEVVKVRVLRSAFTDQEITVLASEITRSTKSALLEIRGHTFTLYKKKGDA